MSRLLSFWPCIIIILAGCNKGFDVEPCVEPSSYSLIDTINVWQKPGDTLLSKSDYIETNIGNFSKHNYVYELCTYNPGFDEYNLKLYRELDLNSSHFEIHFFNNFENFNFTYYQDWQSIYYSIAKQFTFTLSEVESDFLSGSFNGSFTNFHKKDTITLSGNFKIHFAISDIYPPLPYNLIPFNKNVFNIYPESGFHLVQWSNQLVPGIHPEKNKMVFHFGDYYNGVEYSEWELYFEIPSEANSFIIGGDNFVKYKATFKRICFCGNNYVLKEVIEFGYIKGYRCSRGWQVEFNLIILDESEPRFPELWTIAFTAQFTETEPN